MNLISLFVLAVGLSMDAFAVSICKGLAVGNVKLKHMLISGIWFGGFQALMPLLGYFLGTAFEKYVTAVDHWIAFVLLGAIGINMIRESFEKETDEGNASFGVGTMFIMAIATSIDALAVGITFALLPDVDIIAAVSFIGVTTFLFSAVGVRLGSIFGAKYKSKAELAGGIILVALGCKILLEHLGFLNF